MNHTSFTQAIHNTNIPMICSHATPWRHLRAAAMAAHSHVVIHTPAAQHEDKTAMHQSPLQAVNCQRRHTVHHPITGKHRYTAVYVHLQGPKCSCFASPASDPVPCSKAQTRNRSSPHCCQKTSGKVSQVPIAIHQQSLGCIQVLRTTAQSANAAVLQH